MKRSLSESDSVEPHTSPKRKRGRAATLFEGDDLERRRSLGQFFTPPEVARFTWDMVELMRGGKWSQSARVIDPACGEGVFVRVAIERGQPPENCFGVDIDEALVPHWREDSRVHGARLFCANGLVDNPTIGLVPGAFDLVIGNPPFSGKGLKDLLRLANLPANARSKGQRSLFGDEPDAKQANEKSAVAPHERAILDHLARQLCRYMCWRLRGELEEIADTALAENGDGLGLFAGLQPPGERSERTTDYERMAQAVAAWPADRPLDASQPAVRDTLRRLASTAIEVFFTERFVQLAKPGGMVAMIVPESILASDQLAPLRNWLIQQVQLLAVISLPQKVFTGVGAKAKTGIVLGRRYTTADVLAQACLPLSDPIQNTKVLLTAPNIDSEDWSLAGYLAGVIERAERVAAENAQKEPTGDR